MTKTTGAVLRSAEPLATAPLVVKIGGRLEAAALDHLAKEVAARAKSGERIVVVHGGGPAIDAALHALGMEPRFVNGLRVTGRRELEVVESVLTAEIGARIAAAVTAHGVRAVAVSGRTDSLLVAEQVPEESGLGLVGNIVGVNKGLVDTMLAEGTVPVLAPVASDGAGGALNVNADEAASAVAAALHASHLLQVTDVPRVLDADGTPIAALTEGAARRLLHEGVAKDGMVPKLRAAIQAVASGVPAAVIGDANHADPLKRLLGGAGTTVTRADMADLAAPAEG